MKTTLFAADRARQIAAEFELAALPAGFYANPYPYYHAHREHAPIKAMRDGSWFLTRYDDVVAVYRDPKTFSSDKKLEFAPKYGAATPLYEHHTTSLVFNDPPLHTRVRRSILGALSQRHVAAMEPGLVALVGQLLDTMAERRDVDLIDDFAAAIPVEIIDQRLQIGEHLRNGTIARFGASTRAIRRPMCSPG